MDGVTELAQSVEAMSDEELYDRDFPAWCERQAARLRCLASAAAGEEQPDWPRVIEEIEDMGAAERRRVESLLVQAIMHLIKLNATPDGQDAAHWTVEIRAFLGDARRSFAPSMRRAIDMDDLYREAIFRLTGRRERAQCPFVVDDLISQFPDVAALIVKLP